MRVDLGDEVALELPIPAHRLHGQHPGAVEGDVAIEVGVERDAVLVDGNLHPMLVEQRRELGHHRFEALDGEADTRGGVPC